MDIRKVRFWTGPNLYSFKPMIYIELDIGVYEEKPSHLIPGFADKLVTLIPSLRTHTCSLGYEGGFVERLREGTWMGHIAEHVAIELQNLAGIEVNRGKTVTSGTKGIYYVAYEYREKESGLLAFHAAVDIVTGIAEGREHKTVEAYVAEISRLYYGNKLGPSTESIWNAAVRRGIPVERVGEESFLRLGTGSRQKHVQATITSQTSFLAVENSCDKQMTKELLANAGLPVPEGRVCRTVEQAAEAGRSLGYPLVIKPQNGRQGKGVVTNLKHEEELLTAFTHIQEPGTDYIVERYIAGDDYRFLVVNGAVVAASLRLPPRVTGDGKRSIRELIEQENDNPLRGEDHEKPMTRIPTDERTRCYLAKEGLTLDTVPAKGQSVQVLGHANLSIGGMAVDVTDAVHPSYCRIAVEAAAAIGLDVAGIDIISKDATIPFDEREATILEVNASPGIRMHLHPSSGKSRDAGAAIVDYLFPKAESASIPIVAVTGTNGKTTTTRLAAHLLRKEGRRIGMTNSDGIWIDDQCIDDGDCSGPGSARRILSRPDVDLAVLETARGGMMREGLAFRWCDVGIVTNVAEDHLGQDGLETLDQLRRLKQLVAETVRPGGTCILNADDENCMKMTRHTKGRLVLFSLRADNPHIRASLASGGSAWYVEEGWVIVAENGVQQRFMPVDHMPVTMKGLALHNAANAMAALAAARALGKSLAELRSLLITFKPSFKMNRGRFNVLEHDGRTIVCDYAHNPAGVSAMFDAVERLKKRRIITVASAAGDRQDRAIKELGEIIGRRSDVFVIKEDGDLRGRLPMEAAGLLLEGARRAGMKRSRTHIVPDEFTAFREAWSLSVPGDLLLLLHDKFASVELFLKELLTESKMLEQMG